MRPAFTALVEVSRGLANKAHFLRLGGSRFHVEAAQAARKLSNVPGYKGYRALKTAQTEEILANKLQKKALNIKRMADNNKTRKILNGIGFNIKPGGVRNVSRLPEG